MSKLNFNFFKKEFYFLKQWRDEIKLSDTNINFEVINCKFNYLKNHIILKL